MRTYRDFIWSLLPASLRGEYGQRLMLGGLGLLADSVAEGATLAVRSSWLHDDACGDDALQRIGASRRMQRYPGETQASYRARLQGAWSAYAIAGAALAIETQMEAFGLVASSLLPNLDTWTRTGVVTPQPNWEDATGGTSGLRIYSTSATGTYAATVATPCDLSRGGYSRSCAFEVTVKTDAHRYLDLGLTGGVDGGPILERFDLIDAHHESAWASRTGPAWCSIRPVRGASGWHRCRLAFAATGAAVTATIGLSTGGTIYVDPRGLYLGPELVTVHTPFDAVRGDYYFAGTSDEWWSQFWVFIAYGLHRDALTTDQKAALVSIAKRWKDSRWVCQGVVLEGTAPTCGQGLSCGNGAVCGGTDCEVLT